MITDAMFDIFEKANRAAARSACNAAQRRLSRVLDEHYYSRNPEPWLKEVRAAQGKLSNALAQLSKEK